MKTFSTSCIVTVSVALLAVACGGANVSESAFDEPGISPDAAAGADTSQSGQDAPTTNTDGGNTDTGGTVVEDSSPVDTAPPLTAENVCTRLADSICGPSLATCCGTRGVAYKESGCRDAVITDCDDMRDSVADGRTTLNLDAFTACTSAWAALSTKCSMSILEFVKTYAPCNQLFNGTTPFRGSCAEDYQCKVGPGAYASCTGDGRCDSVNVVGDGAPCGNLATTRAFCDVGFYCAYTTSTSGTCRAAKATGASCTQSNECGFGNYCRGGSCAPGLGAGASCSFDQQCASGDCGGGGRCTDPNVSIASPGVCNGSGG